MVQKWVEVSVPYRGATFLNAQGHVLSAYRRKLFPSPIGELHFSISKENLNRQRYVVSVPYRGATFLNEEHLRLRERLSLSFRPLSGSYISQLNLELWMNGFVMFPSPIGELHFSIHSRIILKHWIMVSVPYRGATFLNTGVTAFKKMLTRFPSPIGELHFSILTPLLLRAASSVSVPYRGATFLNYHQVCFIFFGVDGFRPLSGSYISQYHPRNPMFCLGQIGGLRGKSNFIEMQPFWKVKNSHKSSI